MPGGRDVPLYVVAKPCSWNERMVAGEYAVHYSSFGPQHTGESFCTIFPSLRDAESFAKEATLLRPDLRCQIYDHHGMVGAPVSEVRGTAFKGESDLSRFRRWAGGILFVAGAILTAIDWASDFRLSWPAVVGTRMLLPGFILLITEALVVMHARQTAKQKASEAA